jgi:hypothetical protein
MANTQSRRRQGRRGVMAEQLRGIGNLWLNGTLIRNGVQYLVRFEGRPRQGPVQTRQTIG